MQCQEAQGMIPDYLQAKLKFQTRYELLSHISSCSKCREELEFNLIVYDTTGMLREFTIENNDYHLTIQNQIARVTDENSIRTRRSLFRKVRLALLIVIAFILFGFGTGKVAGISVFADKTIDEVRNEMQYAVWENQLCSMNYVLYCMPVTYEMELNIAELDLSVTKNSVWFDSSKVDRFLATTRKGIDDLFKEPLVYQITMRGMQNDVQE